MAVTVEIKGGNELGLKLAQLAARLSTASEVRAGFLEGTTYDDGTSVPMVAAAQNYGSPANGLPPRPFFDQMAEKNRGGWPALVQHGLKQSSMDARGALEFVGKQMEEQIQESIHEIKTPKLKPATVKRKGFDTLLIESSHMLNSVGSEVS